MTNTTIAAISTPKGKGGIAVIRISGDDAAAIGDRVFCATGSSDKPLSERKAGMMCRGAIVHRGSVIDDGMAVIFRAPASYTGEDTVELYCHGGILLTETVLTAVYEAGAVPAGPGEFTRRAFMSGKLPLSRAEAVISLIDAENTAQLKLAAASASGALSRRIDELSARMTSLIASLYAVIDFPDEDLAELTPAEIESEVAALQRDLAALADTYREGHAVAEGIPTVLCGLPNAGKSSLLNYILGRDRAIVTDIPGTTRDTIEETGSLGGVTLRLFDTAGIRESTDEAERLGVVRTLEAMDRAELILSLSDGSCGSADDTAQLRRSIDRQRERGCCVIELVTKSDLPRTEPIPEGAVAISTVTGEGIDVLSERIRALFLGENLGESSQSAAVISNARQHASVTAALKSVRRAAAALDSGLTPDMIGTDLEQAAIHLGQCDGRSVSDQVVDQIFHNFCVGK